MRKNFGLCIVVVLVIFGGILYLGYSGDSSNTKKSLRKVSIEPSKIFKKDIDPESLQAKVASELVLRVEDLFELLEADSTNHDLYEDVRALAKKAIQNPNISEADSEFVSHVLTETKCPPLEIESSLKFTVTTTKRDIEKEIFPYVNTHLPYASSRWFKFEYNESTFPSYILELERLKIPSLSFPSLNQMEFDAIVEGLSSLSSFYGLRIDYSRQVTDLSLLSSLTSLAELRMPIGGMSDLSPLASLTALKSIDFSCCNRISDLSSLSTLTLLESLWLEGCDKITDLSPLSTLINLSFLALSDSDGFSDLSPLVSLTSLVELDVSDCAGLEDFSPISALTSLRKLNLSSCQHLSQLAMLEALVSLTELNLSFCSDISDISPLSSLVSLRVLFLSNCDRITDLAPLSPLVSITELDLTDCDGFSELSALSALTSLTYLYLSCCEEIKDVSPLSTLVSLVELDLSWCVSVTDISALSSLENLRHLKLSNCVLLTSEQIKVLAEKLPLCRIHK